MSNQTSQNGEPTLTLDEFLTRNEREYIKKTLARTDGNITAAASVLGLSRQGLYKKMKRLGIDVFFSRAGIDEPRQ